MPLEQVIAKYGGETADGEPVKLPVNPLIAGLKKERGYIRHFPFYLPI